MKCPSCEAEMADEVLRCPACGTECEPADSEPGADPNAELVCVELARSSSHYAVVVSLLAAEGIPVAVHNEIGPALRGIADGPFSWSPPYGAVRIMVPMEFEEAARELIAAQLPADSEEREMESPTG
jgi:hypothetical protein